MAIGPIRPASTPLGVVATAAGDRARVSFRPEDEDNDDGGGGARRVGTARECDELSRDAALRREVGFGVPLLPRVLVRERRDCRFVNESTLCIM